MVLVTRFLHTAAEPPAGLSTAAVVALVVGGVVLLLVAALLLAAVKTGRICAKKVTRTTVTRVASRPSQP